MGWEAQQVSNPLVKLIFVPQNGGRLMQVIFDGHPFLFVNPRYAGKHFPPSNSEWFNYGGDKLWVLPEGSQDEQHWEIGRASCRGRGEEGVRGAGEVTKRVSWTGGAAH